MSRPSRKPAAMGTAKRMAGAIGPVVDYGNGCTLPLSRLRGTDRAIEAKRLRDTLGLGRWFAPDDWNKVPFSHTVTVTRRDHSESWAHYNNGMVIALAVQPADDPLTRGVAYVWYKTSRELGHGPSLSEVYFPTAPVFGRFIAKTCRGPNVLTGKQKSQVLGAEYDQCFRAVGTVGRDSHLFPRSEVPIAVPSKAARLDQPMRFDCLQHHVKRLDEMLEAMTHAIDMADELADAEKAAGGKVDHNAKVHRQSRCYEVLQPIINAAMRRSGQVEEGMAEYLKASPDLAHYLARWQSAQKGGE